MFFWRKLKGDLSGKAETCSIYSTELHSAQIWRRTEKSLAISNNFEKGVICRVAGDAKMNANRFGIAWMTARKCTAIVEIWQPVILRYRVYSSNSGACMLCMCHDLFHLRWIGKFTTRLLLKAKSKYKKCVMHDQNQKLIHMKYATHNIQWKTDLQWAAVKLFK